MAYRKRCFLIIRVKYDISFTIPVLYPTVEYEIGTDESVSMAVVRAVSAVENREPLSLPPLANAVDTDALDALFDARSDGTPRTGGRLSFVYSNYRLTIDNGEYLTLQPLETGLRETSTRDVDDRNSP